MAPKLVLFFVNNGLRTAGMGVIDSQSEHNILCFLGLEYIKKK
jgi:hypothetical protein